MGVTFSQFFPPKPTLTEANLPSQKGKVFIVTGGASGVGYELCTILYQAGGKVYLAGRSETKAQSAVSKIKALSPISPGELVFLSLHLDDLTTIKPAVEAFTARKTKLDVLFNNAGVSLPPLGCLSTGSRTSKGNESSWPLPPNTNPSPNPLTHRRKRTSGCTGALAARVGSKGILSVTQNPRDMKTSLLRHAPWILGFVTAPLLYSAKMGAYTELWAGLSQDLVIGDGEKYVLPWGRLHPSPRPDLFAALKTGEGERPGDAALFIDYCEKQTAEFS